MLLTVQAQAADQWRCSAICARGINGYLSTPNGEQPVTRYISHFFLDGPASASQEKALAELYKLCRKKTPIAYDMDIFAELWTVKYYGDNYIGNKSVYAIEENSCYLK